MKKIFMLINVMMKNSQSSMSLKKKKNSDKKLSIGMIILYAFLIIYFAAISAGLTFILFSSLKPINQQGMIISIILIIVALTSLIFSIFSCINVYYLSSDIEHLLPLPLKPYEILLSKFAVITLYNYIFEFALGIPAFITYGIMNNESILFYIYSIIILVFMPIIPLIIASFIVMILMSFVNITKHRDKFVLFISVFAIGAAVLINVFSSSMVPTDQSSAMILLEKVNSLAVLLGNVFPFTLPAINCLINAFSVNGLLNLLLFLVLNFAAIGIFAVAGNSLYFKGALGSKESSSKKKLLSEGEISKQVTSKGQLTSFVMKEWKLLYRNPTYLMQCVFPMFIFPVLFFVIFRFNPQYKEIFNMISADPNMFKSPFAFTVLICVLTFFLIGNTSSGSAISRDGSYATISKYIPMDFYKQFIGKMFLGCVFCIIEVILTMVVFSGPLKLSLINAIATSAIIILIGIVQNYIMLIIDLKRPKLLWDNETAVVKNNMNIFIDMIFLLVDMVAVFVIGILINSFSNIFGVDIAKITLVAVLITIHILAWVILDLYVRKNKVKLFSVIE